MRKLAASVVVCAILLSLSAMSALCLSEWDKALLEMSRPSGIVLEPWLMLGPFAHKGDFWQEQQHGPESGVKLDATYRGKDGEVKWRETPQWSHERTIHNFFDIMDFPADDTDCYAYRKVICPADMDACIYYAADDSLVAWLNGKEIVRSVRIGKAYPREKALNVRLRKGENELLLKVGNRGEGFEFYCEVQPAIDPAIEARALEELLSRFPTAPSAIPARFRLIELYQALDTAPKADEHCKALLLDKSLDATDRALIRTAQRYRSRGAGQVTGLTAIPGGAEFATTSGRLLIRFVKAGLARLTYVPSGMDYPLTDKFRPLPVGELDGLPGVSVDNQGDVVRISSGETQVAVNSRTGTVTLHSPKATRQVSLNVYKSDAWADVSVAAGEGLYGGGEQFNGLIQRGRSISVGNSDRAWGGQYLNIPFIMTSNFDGFYLNSYAAGQLDMDTAEFAGKLHMRLNERVADLFWTVGEPKKMVGDYCALTGYPQMPPDWALGVWFSRNSYGNEREVLDAATRLREEKISSEVLVLEAWREGDDGMAHEDWTKWGTTKKWPDPPGLCKKLHEMAYKVVLWTMPWYMVRPAKLLPWEQEAIDKGYFLKNPDGTTYSLEKDLQWCSPSPDFTNPDGVRWWNDRYLPLLDKVTGADAFKTDMGENTGGSAQTYKGWDDVGNLFTALYQKVTYEMTEAKLGEGLVFGRTGGIGSQRYPVLWSGDIWAFWPGISEAISGMLSSSVCGYSFVSSDCGGYWGDPPPKVYIRWLQLGCFQPVMQFHGQSPREPWCFGEEAMPICRYYTDLHVRLRPYIKAAGKVSCEQGIPIVRPLFMEFPSDAEACRVEDEYFFGPDLLIAPVYMERDTREVYLPAGTWVDWWTGKPVKGPARFTVDVDLDKIPVYARSGAEVLSLRPADGKGVKAKD